MLTPAWRHDFAKGSYHLPLMLLSAKGVAQEHLQGLQESSVVTWLQLVAPTQLTQAKEGAGACTEEVLTSAEQHWSMPPFSNIFSHRK